MRLSVRVLLIGLHLAVLLFLTSATFVEASDGEESDLRLLHRINAHGDEFMALALSPDERRLIVGTEKGELIIWGVAEQRILLRFNQGSPVHAVVALRDGHHVVAAGGPHTGQAQGCVVRNWNLETGTFEQWQGAGSESALRLAYNPATGLVASSNMSGRVAVWEVNTGKLVATWDLKGVSEGLAISDRTIYAAPIDTANFRDDSDDENPVANSIIALSLDDAAKRPREIVAKKPGRLWADLSISPDGKMLAASYADASLSSVRIAVLDVSNGRERASFAARAAVWMSVDRLMLFDEEVPSQLVQIGADGVASTVQLSEAARFHAAGNPSTMTGEVVSRDGQTVWEVFQLNALLFEWNVPAKKGTELIRADGFPFAMDALERAGDGGLMITGGDDGFVRIWNLSDLSLRREFRVSKGVPQGVGLLADGRHAVFSDSSRDAPTEIVLGDIETGEQKRLLTLPAPFVRVFAAGNDFVYDREQRILLASAQTGETKREFVLDDSIEQFTVSANGRWLAAADKKGVLYLFEIATGRRIRSQRAKIENLSHLAVTNDGHYVYTTGFAGDLRRWETRSDELKELAGFRGQAHSLRLSVDESRVVIGGDHRDVSVHDATTGKRLAYFQTVAADFYVTNVWLRGNRVIFTTDAGVLFDGEFAH